MVFTSQESFERICVFFCKNINWTVLENCHSMNWHNFRLLIRGRMGSSWYSFCLLSREGSISWYSFMMVRVRKRSWNSFRLTCSWLFSYYLFRVRGWGRAS